MFLDLDLQDSEEYRGTESATDSKTGEKVSYFFFT